MRIIYFFLLTILFWSCANNATTLGINDRPFFDLDQYLDTYIGTLEDSIPVKKLVKLGDSKAESKEILKYDISKDLKLLRKANISDPALLDKYTVDSNSVQGVHYKSISEDQKVLELIIYRTLNEVDSIYAITQVQSMISNQVNSLYFVPYKKFTIQIAEKAVFKNEVENTISIDFK